MADLLIEKQLVAYLAGRPAVAALLGARIYPQDAPQKDAYPYATYFRVDSPRVRHLKGVSGLSHPRIQIDVYGVTYSSAKNAAHAIIDALDPFSGLMGARRVQYARIEEERDSIEEDRQAGERAIHRVSMDVIIWFEESI